MVGPIFNCIVEKGILDLEILEEILAMPRLPDQMAVVGVFVRWQSMLERIKIQIPHTDLCKNGVSLFETDRPLPTSGFLGGCHRRHWTKKKLSSTLMNQVDSTIVD